MSTQIDERVVAMRFDNKQFEAGVAESMSTLDKLKAKLNFTGAEKGFQNLEKAANNVNLSGLEKSAEAVEVKFSAMSIVAMKAIDRIVDTAMNAGTNLVKSLSIDQVTSGFNKLEEMTRSTRTIMGATGLGVEEINKQMDKLNWFTDETSYNLSDMTSNISKFVSNNIPLDESVTAMQGIALWAASAGQGVNEASRAMYNLSQAIGVGSVKIIDWRSIENANMATAEFKRTALEAAVAVGTLTKANGKYYTSAKKTEVGIENFRETLSEGWLDRDTLMNSLKEYGQYADAVYDIWQQNDGAILTADIIEQLGDNAMELGYKAFKAGQEYRTFSDAIAATKDAVSTGWMKSFQIILGNAEEIVEVWSAVGETLWDIFASSAAERNAMLADWREKGGRSALLHGIANGWEAISEAIGAVKKAWESLFPKMTSDQLLHLTRRFALFTSQLKLSEKGLTAVYGAAKLLFTPIKIITSLLSLLGKIAAKVFIEVFKGFDSFLKLLVTPIDELTKGNEVLNRLFTNLGAALSNVWSGISAIGSGLLSLTGYSSPLELISDIFKTIKSTVSNLIDGGLNILADIFGYIAELDFTPLRDSIVSTEWKLDNLGENLKTNFEALTKSLNLVSGKEPADAVEAVTMQVLDLNNASTKLKNSINLGGIFSSITDGSEGIKTAVEKVTSTIAGLTSELSPAKILLTAFGASLVMISLNISKAMEGFAGVGTAVSGTFKALTNAINGASRNTVDKKLKNLAIAIGIFAASLITIAVLPLDKLAKATITIGLMLGALAGLSVLFTKLSKSMNENDIKALKNLGLVMIEMAASIVILSIALNKISKVIERNNIGVSFLTLAGVITALTLAAKFVGKNASDFTKGSAFLIAFSIAIYSLVGSLKKLQKMGDLTEVAKNLPKLLAIILTLSLFTKLSSKMVSFDSAIGIGVLVLDIILMCSVLTKLNDFNISLITNNVDLLIVLVTVMSALMIASAFAGKNAIKGGIGIVALTGAMVLMVNVIKMIGELDPNVADQGTKCIVKIIGILSLFEAMSFFAKNIDKVGKMALKFSIAVGVLAIALKYVGEMDVEDAEQGTVVLGILMGLFALTISVGGVASKATSSIAVMTFTIGILAACIGLLSMIPFGDAMRSSLAMSAALIALGQSMKLITASFNQGTMKTSITTIAFLALLIGGVTAALMLVSSIPTENILASATSLALIMSAVSTIGIAISKANIDMVGAMKGAVAIDGVMIALTPVIYGLYEFMNSEAFKAITMDTQTISSLAGVGAVLAYFAVLSTALGKAFKGSGGSMLVAAAEGTLAIEAVIALVGALAGLVGAIETASNGGLSKLVESGGKILLSVGTIIGGFIGNIVGGFLGGVASGALPTIAQNLASFANGLGPFVETMSSMKTDAIEGLKSTTDLISAVSSLNQNGKNFDPEVFNNLTEGLANIAGPINQFSQDIDGVNVEAINASSSLMTSFIDLLNLMPTVGGLVGDIFGEHSFESMKGLEEFGNGMRAYNDAITKGNGINEEAIVSSANAAKALSELNNSLPSTGGILQDWLGCKDLKAFGEAISEFGGFLVTYWNTIKDANIDENIITNSANAAMALAKLNTNLPASGGILQSFFGEKKLDIWGSELEKFGGYFVSFYNTIASTTFNPEIVNTAATMGETMAKLQETLPNDGGWWQEVFGSKSLGEFGIRLEEFGQGIVKYAETVSNLTPEQMARMNSSVMAAKTLVNLASVVAGTVWLHKDMKSFGTDLEAFGESIAKFSDKTGAINWEDTTKSIESIKAFVAELQTIGQVEPQVSPIVEKINNFKEAFKQAGKNLVEGFKMGIQTKTVTYTTNGAVTQLGDGTLKALKDSLDENSPSKETEKIGKYFVEGLGNGIKDNVNIANKESSNLGNAIIEAIKRELKIHSPSIVAKDEVGVWIVKGVAEGISSDDSAVEAAQKMASNIINAAKNEIAKYDLSREITNLKYQVWQYENPMATEEEKKSKALEDQKDSVKTILQDYQTMVISYEAMEKAYNEGKVTIEELKQAEKERLDLQVKLLEASRSYVDLQEQTVITQEEFNQKVFEAQINDQERAKYIYDYYKNLKLVEQENKAIEDIMKQPDAFDYNANWSRDEWVQYLKDIGYYTTAIQEAEQYANDEMLGYFERLVTGEGYTIADSAQTAVTLLEDLSEEMTGSRDWKNPIVISVDLDMSDFENKIKTYNTSGPKLDPTKDLDDPEDGIGAFINGIGEEFKKKELKIPEDSPLGMALGLASKGLDFLGIDIKKDEKIGENIANGLSEGMDNGQSTVYESGEKLYEAGEQGVRDAGGIHSPSREMIPVGGYIVEGLVKGINDNQFLAVEATANLVNTMINSVGTDFSMQMMSLASKFTDTINEAAMRAEQASNNGEFTIRPVLDLSVAEQQLKELKAKMSAATAQTISASMNVPTAQGQNGSQQPTQVINNYNQTINTPKVATPIEIMRRTKNLMSQIIGGKIVS